MRIAGSPTVFICIQVLLGCCAASLSVKAQRLNHPAPGWDLLFVSRHFSVTVVPGITSKARFEKDVDSYHLSATPQGHLVIGFGYYLHIGQRQSLISGLNLGIVGRNFRYRIPASAFDSTLRNEITSSGPPSREYEFAYVAVPLGFEQRWFKKKGFFNLTAGVSFCYGLQKGREWNGAAVLMPNGSGSIDYFRMPLNKDNGNRPWFNYNFGGGYGLLLSNNHIVKANLLINVSHTNFINGPYFFELPGRPVESGTIRSRDLMSD